MDSDTFEVDGDEYRKVDQLDGDQYIVERVPSFEEYVKNIDGVSGLNDFDGTSAASDLRMSNVVLIGGGEVNALVHDPGVKVMSISHDDGSVYAELRDTRGE